MSKKPTTQKTKEPEKRPDYTRKVVQRANLTQEQVEDAVRDYVERHHGFRPEQVCVDYRYNQRLNVGGNGLEYPFCTTAREEVLEEVKERPSIKSDPKSSAWTGR